METDQGCLIKESTLFFLRSVTGIRCKQKNANRHLYCNGTWIHSFKLYFLLLLTTIHGWPPYGPILPNGTSMGMASQLALCPLSPSTCAHNQSTKPESAGSTKNGLTHLPQPCCSANTSNEQEIISVAKSPVWQWAHPGNKCAQQNCRFFTVLLQGRPVFYGVFLHFCHWFV